MCRIGASIYNNGYVAANDGNITCRIEDDRYLVTPTGISKGSLHPGMIALIDGEGHVLDGLYSPSSEYKVHLQVYAHRPDVRAVVHAHPPYRTAYAVAGLPLDHYMLPESVCGVRRVPLSHHALPGSPELADSILPFFKDHNPLLLAHQRPVAIGKDLNPA